MSANPRTPAARAHPERPVGQPVIKVLPGGARWKILALPSPNAARDLPWRELVAATVERAADRWEYAQEQAVRTARLGRGGKVARAALTRAQIAWANYWELSCDAETMLGAPFRAGRPASA